MMPEDFPPLLTGAGRIVVSDEGCWLRQVRILDRGYSLVTLDGVQQSAHRAAYRIAYGALPPEGMQVDHVCHTRSTTCAGGDGCLHRRCVNPTHLEAVTVRENHYRGKGTPSNRTHCPQGHAYDETNTRVNRQGKRECRACRQAAAHRWYDTHRRSPHVQVEQCLNGHPYSGPNLRIIATTGRRVCRACELERGRAYKARQRALRRQQQVAA